MYLDSPILTFCYIVSHCANTRMLHKIFLSVFGPYQRTCNVKWYQLKLILILPAYLKYQIVILFGKSKYILIIEMLTQYILELATKWILCTLLRIIRNQRQKIEIGISFFISSSFYNISFEFLPTHIIMSIFIDIYSYVCI